MEKVPFNHDAETTSEATGTNQEVTIKKMDELLEGLNRDEVSKLSVIAERIEDSFTPREMCVMLASSIINEVRRSSPMGQLMAMLASKVGEA